MDLPTYVTIDLDELDIDPDDYDEDELREAVWMWLNDTYGYYLLEFLIDVDEFGHEVIVSDIIWDLGD